MTSRFLAVLVGCVLVGSLFAAPAAAVEHSADGLPEEAQVGSDVEATFTMTELFGEFEQWTLRGTTELDNVTWTVRQFDQAGNQIDQTSADGGEFSTDVNIDDGVSRVEVRVTGTAPAIENYTYRPPERFLAANLTQARSGGTTERIATYRVHHYTAESGEARDAIDNASAAVDGSGSDSARALLDSAISSYGTADFDSAVRDAERAGEEASQSTLLRNVAFGVVGLVLLVVLVGGGYRLYKSRRQGPSRLK